MGLQVWSCRYCGKEFGWCSVGGMSTWGEHKKNCKVLKDNIEDWQVWN